MNLSPLAQIGHFQTCRGQNCAIPSENCGLKQGRREERSDSCFFFSILEYDVAFFKLHALLIPTFDEQSLKKEEGKREREFENSRHRDDQRREKKSSTRTSSPSTTSKYPFLFAMVRSYLRHEPTMAFGLVASNAARPVLDQDCKTAYVAALEDVLVWDVKTGNQVSRPQE